MDTSRNPWDDDYLHRGRIWSGSTCFHLKLPWASRILELGCGDGKTVLSLVQSGYCVTAIDFSSHAALLCRQVCTDPDHVRILVADARKTPFSDQSFDVVIASHITSHLTHAGRRKLAGEVFRLLVPGGILHFRDFSIEDFRYGRGEETEAGTFIRKNGIATHYFTHNEVLSLFAGLAVRSLVYHQWEMRVRGTVLPRYEIVAEFEKRF